MNVIPVLYYVGATDISDKSRDRGSLLKTSWKNAAN